MIWGLGIVAILAIALFATGPRTYTTRYRMTVEVDTPEGVREGSAVRESRVLLTAYWDIFSRPLSMGRKGEAVAVDLPGGQTLFALAGEHSNHVIRMSFPHLFEGREFKTDGIHPDHRRIYRYLNDNKPSAELWPAMPAQVWRAAWPPPLVRFRDIADPMTVEAVNPADLAASFGPGFRLRRITVEITDAPIDWGMEKRLLWLPALHGRYLTGEQSSDGSALGLQGGDFSSDPFK